MIEQVVLIVITAGVTGLISTLGTVAALRVHIAYLTKITDRHEGEISRAHNRITKLFETKVIT